MPDVNRLFAQAKGQVDQGQHAAARQTLSRLLAVQPMHAPGNDLMAFILGSQGDAKAALYYAQRAAQAAPDHPGVRSDYASLLSRVGQHDKAIETARSAVALGPALARVHATLVAALLNAGRIAEARDAAVEGRKHAPGDADLTRRLAACELDLANPDRAIAMLAELRKGPRPDPRLAEYQATIANYASLDAPGTGANTAEAIASLHRGLGGLLASAPGPRRAPAPRRERAAGEPIRLAIISSDLRTHSVARFVEPIARHLDRARVEPIVFSTSPTTPTSDAVTARLKGLLPHWHSIPGRAPEQLDALIRGAKCDAAIELGGLTNTANLFALRDRPAPVQISYLGYPNTTGAPFMTHRLVDAITDPPGVADALASEKLHRMVGCFVCYQPPEPLPPARSRPDGPPVLGCFTVVQKISAQTVSLWARVMREVKDATLIIKSESFKDAPTREDIRTRWSDLGMPMERVTLRPHDAAFVDHLDSYQNVHLALDPTPYNGTTSTCDALLMGTPVLALAGPVHAARVSASLLTHSGLGELVADSADAYVAKAAALLSDRSALNALHERVRAAFTGGMVCDGPGFCRRFEDAIERMVAEPASR